METINGIFTANQSEINDISEKAKLALVNAMADGKNVTKILKTLGASCLIDVHPSNLPNLINRLNS